MNRNGGRDRNGSKAFDASAVALPVDVDDEWRLAGQGRVWHAAHKPVRSQLLYRVVDGRPFYVRELLAGEELGIVWRRVAALSRPVRTRADQKNASRQQRESHSHQGSLYSSLPARCDESPIENHCRGRAFLHGRRGHQVVRLWRVAACRLPGHARHAHHPCPFAGGSAWLELAHRSRGVRVRRDDAAVRPGEQANHGRQRHLPRGREPAVHPLSCARAAG